MGACDLDMVTRSAEWGMGGDTLRIWHNKSAGTGTSQTCKGKEEFKVTTAGPGEVLTWEILKTGLRTIACLEAGIVYWYVGVVVTFTTLTGGTKTVLTERLDLITLNTLRLTLTAHSLKRVTERSFTDCMIYRNMDTFIPSTKRRIINGTFTNN